MEEEGGVGEVVDTMATLDLDSAQSDMEAQLDIINKAIEEINSLSTDFLSSRDAFIKAYGAAKARLAKLYVSNKKTVDKARPFYAARDDAYRAKFEHRKSAAWLKKCCEDFEEARQAASKIEEVLLSSASAGSGGTSDLELLSNLNKANDWVIETKKCRDVAVHEQKTCMTMLSRADGHLANLAQQLSQHVLKASSYFESRDKLQRQLDALYYKLWEKNKRVLEAKQKHRDMFTQFSSITTDITKIQIAEDFKSEPPDLSRFEEIQDVDSLDSSFQEIEGGHMSSPETFDLRSNPSSGSVSDISTSHMTKPAHVLSLDETIELNLHENFDVQQTNNQNELFIDYGVSFQMDV